MNCQNDTYVYIRLILVVNVSDQAIQSWLVERVDQGPSANVS